MAFTAVSVAVAPGVGRAATYFVSGHGNDSSSGTSRQHAWRTVARVNSAHLHPGDRVRFQGGQTFMDATLTPPASGVAHRRIRFDSYGHGRATIAHDKIAVWFSDLHYVTFAGLTLTTNNTDGAVLSGSPGRGSSYITIRRCVIKNTAGVGVQAPTEADSHWRIVRSWIFHTGDSGLILWGPRHVVARDRIVDTGWNAAIPWDKHGIYVKGSYAVIRGNVISRFQANGVSLRFDNARVSRNTIRNGPFGIAYFDFSKRSGTTRVLRNHVSKVRVGFYFSTDADRNDGSHPHENFVVRHNVFHSVGGVAADVIGAQFSRLVFVGNLLNSDASVALRAASPAGGSYVEHDNRFGQPVLFEWNRMWIPYGSYRHASGQGARDRFAGRSA